MMRPEFTETSKIRVKYEPLRRLDARQFV